MNLGEESEQYMEQKLDGSLSIRVYRVAECAIHIKHIFCSRF